MILPSHQRLLGANMKTKYDVENELFTSLLNGDVYDFTWRMPSSLYEEELAELLYTWSVFKGRANFEGAINRHIQNMCNRIAEHVARMEGIDGDYVDEDGNWLDECDGYYENKKDNEAEKK